MAEQRLSRLQKWTLQTTCEKTINKTLPDDWRHSQAWDFDGMFTKDDMAIFWKAIYRPEILANYFDLPFVSWIDSTRLERPWSSFFSMVGDHQKKHNKANVTMHRSLVNMREKKLLKKVGEGYALTVAGKKKAEQLLKNDQSHIWG